MEWINKDLKYAKIMSEGVEHPLLDKVQDLFQKAVDEGYARSDWTKINKI